MSHRPTKILLAAGALLLLSVGSYIAVGRHMRATGVITVSVARAATTERKHTAQARSEPAVRSCVEATTRNPREIITSLTGGVSDWREFAPEQLTVQLRSDLSLPFTVTKIQRDGGRTVLTARISGASAGDGTVLENAFMVSTANAADSFEAIVALPGEEYHLHVSGDQTVVEQVTLTDFRCGTTSPAADRLGAEGPQAEQAAAAPAPTTADVLFAANPETLAFRAQPLLDADCSNFIAAGNAVLQNSQVTNFTWRYLGVVATPAYPTTTKIMDDFNQLTSGSLSSFATQAMAQYGADQLVLFVGERSDYGGLGECPGHHCVTMFPVNGFVRDASGNVIYDGNVPRQGPVVPSYFTTVHEMGHGFGCQHDRATCITQKTGGQAGDGRYNYGFVFSDATDTRFPPTATGTIMSYTQPTIPNFSNSNVTYHGYATGVADDQPLAADNARTLTEAASAMAAYNNPPGAPTISQQPQSVTVTSGNSFTLSVTASGNGTLTYQWFKGGQSIAGAVSSNYSVTGVLTGDAGQYTVTVTNSIGSTTSSAATVTVYPAPANQGSTGSSSGGGGGGGAPSLWFYGALGLLLCLRAMTNRPAGPTSAGEGSR